MIGKICLRCGRRFNTWPSTIRLGGGKYCSRFCVRSPVESRFWQYVHKSNGCWTWIGWKQQQGYGLIASGRNALLAHRASWMIHFGTIPHGLLVCHRCDNPPCVRPDHLFLGTYKDNSMDSQRKGRSVVMPRMVRCKRGHKMSPENIYCYISGDKMHRRCRVCAAYRGRKYRREGYTNSPRLRRS